MKNWTDALSNEKIFYITPDVKRGIGPEGILPNYHIICSYSDPLIPILRKQGAKIFCLEETVQEINIVNNSGKLLEHPQVDNYIKINSKNVIPGIIAFKPSIKIETICQRKGYKLLINKFYINDLFEDKTNFFKLISEKLPGFSVPGCLGYLKELDFSQTARKLGLPMVVQFSHGWAGKTTFFIKSSSEFTGLVQRFPQTYVRVNKFIDGFTVLNNACIYKGTVIIGPSALQINNVPEIMEKPEVTCGRQWPVSLESKQISEITQLSEKVGHLMIKKGFLGFFGLDFLIEEKSGRIYLSENNARFTASSAFYTKLELGKNYIPLMIYHLSGFLGKDVSLVAQDKEIEGSQIVFRNPGLRFQAASNIDYAVYRHDAENFSVVRTDYYPQDLENNELIFARRIEKKLKNIDSERARIETKTQVLKKEGTLKDWVKKFIE